MSVTFVVSSTQIRLLPRPRLLAAFYSTVLPLVSLTPLPALSASFLRCYARCACAVGKSVMLVTLVVPSTQVRLLLRLRVLGPFFSAILAAVLPLPLCLLLFCTFMSGAPFLSVSL